jgi:hypothetical protein
MSVRAIVLKELVVAPSLVHHIAEEMKGLEFSGIDELKAEGLVGGHPEGSK